MTIAKYVAVDGSNVVQRGPFLWDGVANLGLPGAWVTHLLPDPPPAFVVGDVYNIVTDVVTPHTPTQTEVQQQNAQTLLGKMNTAFTTNDTFLALGSPSQAQTLAQVQALTKQMNGLGRLIAGKLDNTSDT